MDNLFSALRALVPGSEVLDVRFLTNQSEVGVKSAGDIAEEIAVALDGAEPSDIACLS